MIPFKEVEITLRSQKLLETFLKIFLEIIGKIEMERPLCVLARWEALLFGIAWIPLIKTKQMSS